MSAPDWRDEFYTSPPGVQWLIKSSTYPGVAIPARDEADARAQIAKFRAGIKAHKMQAAFEYGYHDPAEPNSYWRIYPAWRQEDDL